MARFILGIALFHHVCADSFAACSDSNSTSEELAALQSVHALHLEQTSASRKPICEHWEGCNYCLQKCEANGGFVGENKAKQCGTHCYNNNNCCINDYFENYPLPECWNKASSGGCEYCIHKCRRGGATHQQCRIDCTSDERKCCEDPVPQCALCINQCLRIKIRQYNEHNTDEDRQVFTHDQYQQCEQQCKSVSWYADSSVTCEDTCESCVEKCENSAKLKKLCPARCARKHFNKAACTEPEACLIYCKKKPWSQVDACVEGCRVSEDGKDGYRTYKGSPFRRGYERQKTARWYFDDSYLQ